MVDVHWKHDEWVDGDGARRYDYSDEDSADDSDLDEPVDY